MPKVKKEILFLDNESYFEGAGTGESKILILSSERAGNADGSYPDVWNANVSFVGYS